MRETGALVWKLLIVSLVAGLALGGVYAVTKAPIAAQQREAADEARRAVLPRADSFRDDGGGIMAGLDAAGAPIGYALSGACKGYGGPIEVTVGVDADGVITGVRVGGAGFAETAGLGAETKKPGFTSQFTGMRGEIAIEKDGGAIAAVSSATISSRAVANEVNELCAELSAHIGGE